MQRIGVVVVPPPEESGREVNRHARQEFEPSLPELWLVAKFPRHPLRRCPHGDEYDQGDDEDLTPKDLGRGHGRRSSAPLAIDKSCIEIIVRSGAKGYNSDNWLTFLMPSANRISWPGPQSIEAMCSDTWPEF